MCEKSEIHIFGRRLNKSCKASILFLSMHTMYTSRYQHCNIRRQNSSSKSAMSRKTRILNKHKLSFALEIETHYYILAYVLSRMAYIASISIKLLCDPLSVFVQTFWTNSCGNAYCAGLFKGIWWRIKKELIPENINGVVHSPQLFKQNYFLSPVIWLIVTRESVLITLIH